MWEERFFGWKVAANKRNYLEYKVIEFEKRDQIATIALNRPDRLNAWTMRMHIEYRHALKAADEDAHVRAIIVTGNGRGFCAGADSRALETVKKKGYSSADKEELVWPGAGISEDFRASFAYHYGLRKPVVAAINGPAIGLGNDVACLADIRIASEKAKFGVTFLKIGLIPGDGGAWLLPKIIGFSKAAELLYTGKIINPETAKEWGLISEISKHESLMEDANALALEIVKQPPDALRMAKKLLREGITNSFDTVLEMSANMQALMHLTEDHQEALSAFFEKRDGNFKGK